jgi:hypothetical protein
MPIKLDSSIYKGFLRNLEKAMQEKYFMTIHFFRDPTIRGTIIEIDKEVYVATVENESGDCIQFRLNQITSLTWKKNGEIDLTPKGLNNKSRKKAIVIEKTERDKLEDRIDKDSVENQESATNFMNRRNEEKKEEKEKEVKNNEM